MFTCSPQENNIVGFIKIIRSKVYIRVLFNTVLFPERSTAVCVCLVIVVHESLVCPEQLKSASLHKNTSAHTNPLVFQHFCVFEPFPTMTL